jgi:hypothetical protein
LKQNGQDIGRLVDTSLVSLDSSPQEVKPNFSMVRKVSLQTFARCKPKIEFLRIL